MKHRRRKNSSCSRVTFYALFPYKIIETALNVRFDIAEEEKGLKFSGKIFLGENCELLLVGCAEIH